MQKGSPKHVSKTIKTKKSSLVPGQRKSISQQTDGKEPINTSKQEKKHAGRPP